MLCTSSLHFSQHIPSPQLFIVLFQLASYSVVLCSNYGGQYDKKDESVYFIHSVGVDIKALVYVFFKKDKHDGEFRLAWVHTRQHIL